MGNIRVIHHLPCPLHVFIRLLEMEGYSLCFHRNLTIRTMFGSWGSAQVEHFKSEKPNTRQFSSNRGGESWGFWPRNQTSDKRKSKTHSLGKILPTPDGWVPMNLKQEVTLEN